MVKWQGRRQSANIEDRRGQRTAAGAGIGGAGVMLVRFVLTRFGFKGIGILIIGAVVLTALGVNPLSLLSGAPSGPARQAQHAPNDQASQFVSTILAETEDTWGGLFQQAGARYEKPTLVMFSGQVNSACGFASAASGPFYCPADKKVYLDTSFFDELSQRFGAPGDFAAAYVIAHEVGHHVQTISGISAKVRQAQSQVSETEQNALQVRMELQADCYAGVWAHYADNRDKIIEAGDIQEGLRAAAAIGDDTLQRNAGRRVTPESFTHGSAEQRQRWFTKGFQTGNVAACDSFAQGAL